MHKMYIFNNFLIWYIPCKTMTVVDHGWRIKHALDQGWPMINHAFDHD